MNVCLLQVVLQKGCSFACTGICLHRVFLAWLNLMCASAFTASLGRFCCLLFAGEQNELETPQDNWKKQFVELNREVLFADVWLKVHFRVVLVWP